MNWLDLVLLILLLVSAVTAFSKGITREVIGLISVVGALLLSSWLYGVVGGYLQPYLNSRSTANLCGFLLVFLGVMILGALIGAVIAKLLRITGLSFVDRLLGLAFGVARGVLLAAALVMAIMAFAPGAAPPAAVVDSKYSPYVVDAARAMAEVAPHELKEGFHRSYEQVRSIWKDALKKGIHSLPAKEKEPDEREI